MKNNHCIVVFGLVSLIFVQFNDDKKNNKTDIKNASIPFHLFLKQRIYIFHPAFISRQTLLVQTDATFAALFAMTG